MTNTYFPMLVINYFMYIKFMAYNVKKHYGSGSSCDISNLDNRYINNIILIFQNVAYISSHTHTHIYIMFFTRREVRIFWVKVNLLK